MVITSGLRDPMMPAPSECCFGWRILRRNVSYWQGQVNYLKRHFGVTYEAPIVRPVIATRFKTLRNVGIFERVVNGEKCLAIAKDHEVTVASILQIWKLVARYCRETAVLNGLTPPPIPSLYAVRTNKELWLGYLEMFKKTLEGK